MPSPILLREVPTLFIKQYVLECLSHASYLIVDEASGVAIVVDPERDVTEYIADATEASTTIQHIVLTHFHGDFVTSHLEFRDRFDSTIHIGSRGQAAYNVAPVHDGDSLEFDGVTLRFIETPGHTPESICVVVYDKTDAPDTPYAVLTGETLMIGDVGRPDLVACGEQDPLALAEELYGSINGDLNRLPDETLVYSSHSPGSICGPHTNADMVSTMGIQRTFNYALQPMSKEAFVAMVTADQSPVPSYWGWDAQLARRNPPFLPRDVTLARVMPDGFAGLVQTGVQVLDGRDPVDFAGAHFKNSINVGLDGALAAQARTALDLDRPAYVVVYPGGEAEIVVRLAGVGMTHVVGFLSSGMGFMEPWLDLVTRSQRVAVLNLVDQRLRANAPTVLDVRDASAWQAGHIDGAINVPLESLAERLDELPTDRALVLYCEAGFRAPVATSILQRAGIGSFAELIGGMQAWLAYGLPTTSA
jgi:hydroxyacylglutathione hydrolase